MITSEHCIQVSGDCQLQLWLTQVNRTIILGRRVELTATELPDADCVETGLPRDPAHWTPWEQVTTDRFGKSSAAVLSTAAKKQGLQHTARNPTPSMVSILSLILRKVSILRGGGRLRPQFSGIDNATGGIIEFAWEFERLAWMRLRNSRGLVRSARLAP